jgi:dethiobiotin synthetase
VSLRIYILGTDTEVGKTTITCALLRQARAASVQAIPFKPAQSGAPDEPTDARRLLRAAGLSEDLEPRACPHRYDAPLAPGIAENIRPFLSWPSPEPDPAPLRQAAEALDRWEAEHRPEITFVEGAGGFHVPMPGGTWQPEWIRELAHAIVVVSRVGLGTINHTLLTLDAAKQLGLPILGIYFSQTHRAPDLSQSANPAIIKAARETPVLGVLPYGAPDNDPPDLWTPLVRALPEPSTHELPR